MGKSLGRAGAILPAALFVWTSLAACESSPEPSWQIVGRHLPGALLSVWGSGADDVFIAGADAGDGRGPTVLHFDGTSWARLATGQQGNLWWVFGFPGGPVYFGGDGGMVLEYRDGSFTRMATPGTDTVFGIWGVSPDDLWAVGGANGGANGGFAWRLSGGTWLAAPGFPAGVAATDAIWKIYGRASDDAWMVGTRGKAVRWDGSALREMTAGTGESLFTVHADAGGFIAVGGFGTGKIMENTGNDWHDVSPSGAPGFIGVCLAERASIVTGQDGAVFARNGTHWSRMDIGFQIDESFHSVWIDPSGDIWTVGGQVQVLPLVDGIVLHRGTQLVEELQ